MLKRAVHALALFALRGQVQEDLSDEDIADYAGFCSVRNMHDHIKDILDLAGFTCFGIYTDTITSRLRPVSPSLQREGAGGIGVRLIICITPFSYPLVPPVFQEFQSRES